MTQQSGGDGADRSHPGPENTPRLRLKRKAPRTGYVDGAWWPHSDDLAAELPDLLAVLSAGAVIYPIEVSKQNFMRDYGAMSAITLLLALFIFWPRKQRQLSKVEGAILLSGYAAYLGYLYQQTVTA